MIKKDAVIKEQFLDKTVVGKIQIFTQHLFFYDNLRA